MQGTHPPRHQGKEHSDGTDRTAAPGGQAKGWSGGAGASSEPTLRTPQSCVSRQPPPLPNPTPRSPSVAPSSWVSDSPGGEWSTNSPRAPIGPFPEREGRVASGGQRPAPAQWGVGSDLQPRGLSGLPHFHGRFLQQIIKWNPGHQCSAVPKSPVTVLRS